MDISIIHNALHFWNGSIDGEVLTFDNENGKGRIEGIQVTKYFQLVTFDFILHKDLKFISDGFTDRSYINIFIANPGNIRRLAHDQFVDNILYKSFGIICFHINGQLEWSYTKSVHHKFVALRVEKEKFKEYSTQYNSTRALLNLDKEFIIFEDFDPVMKWFIIVLFRVKKSNPYHG